MDVTVIQPQTRQRRVTSFMTKRLAGGNESLQLITLLVDLWMRHFYRGQSHVADQTTVAW